MKNKLPLNFLRFGALDMSARCDDCDFHVTSNNGHGVAAQHAYRTGHTVHIEKQISSTITHDDHEWYHSWMDSHNKR